MNVAVDGWEDHQKHPTLAFTVSTPSGKTYLWQFDRMNGSQTGDALRDEVASICHDLLTHGLTVVGLIADNAANIQRGLALVEGEEVDGRIKLNCLAHTLSLTAEDLGHLFQKQLDQLHEVEVFFRFVPTVCVCVCVFMLPFHSFAEQGMQQEFNMKLPRCNAKGQTS